MKESTPRFIPITVTVVVVALIFHDPAYGDSIALVDIDPVLDTDDDGPFFGFQEFIEGDGAGFSFTADQQFEVTGLGLFDEGQDGMGSYTVSLLQGDCRPSCNSVLDTVVTGLDPLVDVWRMRDVAPQTFPAGDYVVFSNTPTGLNVVDPVWFVNAFAQFPPFPPFPIAQGFQIGLPAIEQSGMIDFILVNGALFGPNLFITPIPEPSYSLFAFLFLFGGMASRLRGRS